MDFHEILMEGDFKTDNIKSKNGTLAIDIDDSTGKITIKTDLKLESPSPSADGILVCDGDGNISFNYKSIPAGSKVLFESNTAMTGYTLDTSYSDSVIYMTKGSDASGETGDTSKSGSTWSISSTHNHTVSSTGTSHTHSHSGHSLTIAEMGLHYHTLYYNGYDNINLVTNPDRYVSNHNYGDRADYSFFSTNLTANAGKTSYTGSGNSHTHSVNSGGSHTHTLGNVNFGSSWRPYGMNYTLQQRD